MLRSFSYGTHDVNPSLTGLVIANIYNMTTGSPVLLTTTALTLHTLGVYRVSQELQASVPWAYDIGVYQTTTGGSLDGNYVPACGEIAKEKVDFEKNYALSNFTFPMCDANGAAATGLTVVAKRSIDGAAFALCANAVSEISLGKYKLNLAAADLNGDVIHFEFSAVGALTSDMTVVTK